LGAWIVAAFLWVFDVDRLFAAIFAAETRVLAACAADISPIRGTHHEIHHCNRGAGRRLAACRRRAWPPRRRRSSAIRWRSAMGDFDPMLDARLRWEDVDATSKPPMPSPCACAPVSS
jgi:hypothetical protein